MCTMIDECRKFEWYCLLSPAIKITPNKTFEFIKQLKKQSKSFVIASSHVSMSKQYIIFSSKSNIQILLLNDNEGVIVDSHNGYIHKCER